MSEEPNLNPFAEEPVNPETSDSEPTQFEKDYAHFAQMIERVHEMDQRAWVSDAPEDWLWKGPLPIHSDPLSSEHFYLSVLQQQGYQLAFKDTAKSEPVSRYWPRLGVCVAPKDKTSVGRLEKAWHDEQYLQADEEVREWEIVDLFPGESLPITIVMDHALNGVDGRPPSLGLPGSEHATEVAKADEPLYKQAVMTAILLRRLDFDMWSDANEHNVSGLSQERLDQDRKVYEQLQNQGFKPLSPEDIAGVIGGFVQKTIANNPDLRPYKTRQ